MNLNHLKKLMQAGAGKAELETAAQISKTAADDTIALAKPAFPTKALASTVEFPLPDANQMGIEQLKTIARQYEGQGAGPYHPTMKRIQAAINTKLDRAVPAAKKFAGEEAPTLAPMALRRTAMEMGPSGESEQPEFDQGMDVNALPEAYRNPANSAVEPSMDPMDVVSPAGPAKAVAGKLPKLLKMFGR